MQFKNFKSRRLELKSANKGELEEYKRQVQAYHTTGKDKITIFEYPGISFLAVKNESGEQIGLIKVDEIDKNTVTITVSIPNISWKERYGKETIHQFAKCCRQRNLYSKIYLKTGNSISTAYKKERMELFEKGNAIDVMKI